MDIVAWIKQAEIDGLAGTGQKPIVPLRLGRFRICELDYRRLAARHGASVNLPAHIPHQETRIEFLSELPCRYCDAPICSKLAPRACSSSALGVVV